ncbi:glycoside hydrolase domain-containing protein [Lacrimispora sp. BS-2]|uniref:Glycoside hydrolase domain-containing protein n=1 Tax=Lacrimispora sp. BS-2 TaxID=3151850 RepID=A0AAU7PMR3_9FIRM
MADINVIKAQKYLNAMFGGHPSWVALDEDGYTGTAVMQGIIRAFQIQNGISSITGTVGPITINKMKSLSVIEKMNPDDESNINVCLIQCALFCKGYNAGGITGIYYTTGVSAVRKMQADAGLTVTGRIDWKVWTGLLSMNWFQKVFRGDSTTRLIQQQLNSDWSDIIGVGPCDGVVSRQTALSLVGALQAAEGVTTNLITDLNSVNFGDATTKAFPGSLKSGQNSSAYVPFNKLVQYGLYFNGYDPRRFDGIFENITRSEVKAFQEFYGLTGIGLVTEGEVNVSTMKSLLTSKGDTGRKAKACDCATVLNRQQALDLKNAGYTHVGRYLTGSVGIEHIPKYLTLEEIGFIEAAGLNVFPIYQDGGYYLKYFQNPSQGSIDAQTAVLAAERIGIPENTTIYFAVDFDCYEYQITTFIIPYFRRINLFFNSAKNSKKYKVGIYAPRYVCTKINEQGLAKTSFVADMSTGFSCNLGFPIPSNWAFDQFNEQQFTSSPSFPIDKDAYSGRDSGVFGFDKVKQKTDEELQKENREALLEIARNQYIYDVLDPLGYMNKALEVGITYNKKILLDTYTVGKSVVTITAAYSQEMKTVAETDYNIKVGIDNSGSLTMGCQDQISEITSDIDLGELGNGADFSNVLTSIALSVKSGNISFGYDFLTPKQIKVTISVSSEDLLPEVPGLEAGITVQIEFKITINNDSNDQFDAKEFAAVALKTVAVVAIVAVICLVASTGVGALLEFLASGGFLVLA